MRSLISLVVMLIGMVILYSSFRIDIKQPFGGIKRLVVSSIAMILSTLGMIFYR